MNIYQEKLLDHYENPRNYGAINNCSSYFKAQNLSCGDIVELYLLINNNKLEDIKFKAEGCSVAISSMSILSEFVKNKSIKDIINIDLEKLIALIGINFTPSRLKCAGIGLEALKGAINKYLDHNK